MTDKRFKKIQEVVFKRQKYLTIVLENIHDPHNVGAILRSADAVGIDTVYLVYNKCKFPKVGRVSSASADKWIELKKYKNVQECFNELRENRYKIYSTHISDSKKNYSLFELNLTGKVALVFGNEHEGVSDDVKNLADRNFIVPMYGMVQSLNVSVTVAVCLYEALRQRELKGKYDKSGFNKIELKEKLEHYLQK